jgi:hypothetical protein
VAIFGTLKLYWTQEKERWHWEKKQAMTKENFLQIYGHAHARALTGEHQICIPEDGLLRRHHTRDDDTEPRDVCLQPSTSSSNHSGSGDDRHVVPSTQTSKKAMLHTDSALDLNSDAPNSPMPENPSPPCHQRLPNARPDPFSTPIKDAIASL